MKKKILSMVLVVALVATLFAGCGGTATTGAAADADAQSASTGLFPAVPKDQIKVGVIHITAVLAWGYLTH